MPPDPQLDALLRNVPLPDGLVARLQASPLPSEEELDAALKQVLLPLGLVRDLQAIPRDEVLDERLCTVAVPFELVRLARRPTWTMRWRQVARRAGELAVALTLFLCVAISMTGATVAVVASIYPQAMPPDEPAFIVAANLPLAFESEFASSASEVTVSWPVAMLPAPESKAELARTVLDLQPPDTAAAALEGPVEQWLMARARGLNPLDNVVLMRWGVLGYPQYGEEVAPPLESPTAPQLAGMELPLVRGYDRAFALRHGVFPPVNPAAHRALATVALPLTTQTASHKLVQWQAQQGRWPAAWQVRTEEFLAAMDYDLPPANPGELAIRTAAGPSVFGPSGAGLLQLAAVAGAFPREAADSSHLVLAIDMSQSMARGQRLDLVRQAIDRLLTRVGPHDRLSLVVFDEQVRYQVERATAAEASDIRRLLTELRPAGGTDLAEGLQQAAALAMTNAASPGGTNRLVLITDSQVTMPPATRSLMSEVLESASESGVRLNVLDVGDHPDVDETLVGWAEMMHGELYRPQTADAAAWRLIQWLYGRSPVVASEARMTVRFNPQAVAAYRLIGQEANSLASLRPEALAAELRGGEVATALLEVWFQANDENDVAEVELTWREPATGQQHQRTQRISRLQFAPTWEQSPISLQQAAIAAETAEVLRGSRTALRELGISPQGTGSLDGLLEAAGRVHPRLATRPEFRDWQRLLLQLSKIRPR